MGLKNYKTKEIGRQKRNEYKRDRYLKEKKTFGSRPRRRYTKDEIKMVMEHNMPDVEIAKLLGTTTANIQTRRNVWKNANNKYLQME